jgi:hypothetical protein
MALSSVTEVFIEFHFKLFKVGQPWWQFPLRALKSEGEFVFN